MFVNCTKLTTIAATSGLKIKYWNLITLFPQIWFVEHVVLGLKYLLTNRCVFKTLIIIVFEKDSALFVYMYGFEGPAYRIHN